jgi:rSAM/selenodomain-associated transferase 1
MTPSGRALVLAKAPVPGRVKTRLAATVGLDRAAWLAAAALLDTVAACRAAFEECHLALDGELGDAVRREELLAATSGWHVFPQAAGDLGVRLAHAHETAAAVGSGPVVQVGMDTPQVTPHLLRSVAGRAAAGTAVLGPAVDGGWWVLGLASADGAHALAGVPMSRADTGAATRAALRGTGLRVRSAEVLRDVDTAADAAYVAATAPGTRFAAAWREVVAA